MPQLENLLDMSYKMALQNIKDLSYFKNYGSFLWLERSDYVDKPVPFLGFPLSPMKVPSCSNAVGSFVLVTFMPKKNKFSSHRLKFDRIFHMLHFWSKEGWSFISPFLTDRL